ncbi:ATPase family AAA domain-containing protein 2B-like isoform X1 [Coregonus clupeaformis]|uniref:ATPase family AAA domain-containing protein 2B-like isoform X1 n=2 Tax=Coregonus clupeaformis TaxID=59861 RepID=UPI001E1C8BA6|nr:ATPase family AAA domain-containing protein 2B-like isoform X1 [Coregonus clupeaformis]
MVNTRKNSRHEQSSPFISSRTRSSARNPPNSEEHKDPSSDVSSPSSPGLSPPSKRTRRQTSSSDTSPSPQAKGQRVSWGMPTYRTRLSSGALQNGNAHKEEGAGDHSHMNGHVDRKRSCQVRKSQFEHLNQSLLFDQLVNSTAEAVLQEMDNISSIRQNREVERLRMWTDTEVENMDMYSRVKRRKALHRNTFVMQTHHKAMSKTEEEEGTEESHGEEEDDEAEDDDDERDEAEEAGEENDRPYNLRQRKTVQRYEAPPIEPINRKQTNPSLFDTHRSPARRSHIRVKKHAIHSSDTTSSSDEDRFERRKSKNMTRARNRCLPMNLRAEDLASGVLRDRAKVGASLADVDPMNLDSSVKFDSVGGLSNHIQSLKEMVVFPLLYPEVFERFKIQPPRGCLFYGPPGTGKTLVARALANECSQGDKKVSFFMRKGADCLSKWVGESERQLRLLFDQAYLMRPSIIFFDEIDGLAPVRSSRQDQIHSSIVSTLLALMDGLDSRGEIVVIGATNRLDSIDPALRRPGRFDREFLFNLPDKKARRQILEIHTRDWNPRLAEQFVDELAEKCVGYCGADIKALCTEAALVALRRRYPQIYGSSVKLQLDVSTIVLGPGDFSHALRTIVPASQRAQAPPGRALAPNMRPLLANTLATVLEVLLRVFPHAETQSRGDVDDHLLEEEVSEEETAGAAPSIYNLQPGSPKTHTHPSSTAHTPFLHFSISALHQPTSYRPRLLLAGPPGSGQSSHLAPAVLHHLDKLSVHLLDLPTLYSVSAKTPEESCTQVFREARRSVPSVVFMPHICDWWDSVSDTVKNTFFSLLQDVPSFSPLLILATTETCYTQLPQEVKLMFQRMYGEVVSLSSPGEEARRRFFTDLLLVQAARAPPHRRHKALRSEEVLPVVEVPGPRILSPKEQHRLADQEENTLRELRLFLRDVTKRLAIDKRFNIFSKPVNIEEVSDYLEVIIQPMDLSTVMTKIDTHKYLTAKDFLVDIDLICSNALEYNPDKEPSDKIIRHRACSLKDTAHAMLASELDPEFNRMCEEIKESRRKRDLQTPDVPPVSMAAVVTTRKPVGEENPGSSTQGEPVDKQHCSSSNHIKRKARRRPSWGRGIIRKKKNYKKGTEEEEEDEGAEPEPEMGVPSDSCLTQDEESSCDTMDPQPNGHHTNPHTHGISTEEESSNEPPETPRGQRTKTQGESSTGTGPKEEETSATDDKANSTSTDRDLQSKSESSPCKSDDSHCKNKEPQSQEKEIQSKDEGSQAESENPQAKPDDPKPKEEGFQPMDVEEVQPKDEEFQSKAEQQLSAPTPATAPPVPQEECVNGNESMDSLDSQALKSSEREGPTEVKGEGSEGEEDVSASAVSRGTQERRPQDGRTGDTETGEEEQDREGWSKGRKCRMSQSEQSKGSTDRTEEPPQIPPPPPPALVVDQQRLTALLDTVVQRSEGYSVERLERLFSLLSQCIYQHRLDYDKTRLQEEMERKVQNFITFL